MMQSGSVRATSSTVSSPQLFNEVMGTVSESALTEPGTVGWTYTVSNAAVQYLALNQTATESFTVTISDGQGGTVDQVVTVTVTRPSPVDCELM